MEDKLEATDPLYIHIDKQLKPFSTESSSGCSIFRVPNPIRQTNKKAYEPHIVSIGPYHHGKDHLEGMEVRKMHYLKRFLQRREIDKNSAERYATVLEKRKEDIRKCYAEPLDYCSNKKKKKEPLDGHSHGSKLVQMMLLDGCFIIELIREYQIPGKENSNLAGITRDLLLLENQLPFFVLLELFKENLEPNPENNLIHMALDFFSRMMPGPGIQQSSEISAQEIETLLGLVHDRWLPSPKVIDSYSRNSAKNVQFHFKRNAIALQEAGIKFKKRDEKSSLFDIEFEKGVLQIPTLRMDDHTDSILRNLIAHEQCHNDCSRYVTDYVKFMDCLIDTRKDVELLCHSRTIVNGLGDHKVVAMATIFNKLGHLVEISDRDFYSPIYNKVKKHREGTCNVWRAKWDLWMAKLKRNYFNSPWALISFLAAVFLLILTTVQTIYSLLSYYQQ